jgi:2,3-bisphosphoglycerate-dependent phosphoglycerate mutase
MLRVLLVRHATPVLPDVWSDEYTRPLTETGLQQASSLEEECHHLELDAVYSSPYLRAIQTVQPLAAARGLTVRPVEDLREHRLSAEPIDHWREVLERAWSDLDFAPPSGETMRVTQTRAWNALEKLCADHASGTIAIGGHGTAFSLLLHKIDPRVNAVFHLAMPMPAVYTLEFDGTWRIANGPGLETLI